MGATSGGHLCGLGCASGHQGAGAASLPLPFAIMNFPALEFVLSPSLHVNYFTGQQQSLVRASRDYPLPPHSHGNSGIPRAGAFITAAPSRRFLCCLGPAALLCPVPSFPLLLSFPNSHPSKGRHRFPPLTSDGVPGSGDSATKQMLGGDQKVSQQGLGDTSAPKPTGGCSPPVSVAGGSHVVAAPSLVWDVIPCLAIPPHCAGTSDSGVAGLLFEQQPG